MRVKMLQYVEDAVTLDDPADMALKDADQAEDPGRFKDWSPRSTDRGQLLSLYVIETLRPGQIYDLPKGQAQKLVRIGYAERA